MDTITEIPILVKEVDVVFQDRTPSEHVVVNPPVWTLVVPFRIYGLDSQKILYY